MLAEQFQSPFVCVLNHLRQGKYESVRARAGSKKVFVPLAHPPDAYFRSKGKNRIAPAAFIRRETRYYV
jgi:hypothetical protein